MAGVLCNACVLCWRVARSVRLVNVSAVDERRVKREGRFRGGVTHTRREKKKISRIRLTVFLGATTFPTRMIPHTPPSGQLTKCLAGGFAKLVGLQPCRLAVGWSALVGGFWRAWGRPERLNSCRGALLLGRSSWRQCFSLAVNRNLGGLCGQWGPGQCCSREMEGCVCSGDQRSWAFAIGDPGALAGANGGARPQGAWLTVLELNKNLSHAHIHPSAIVTDEYLLTVLQSVIFLFDTRQI